MKINTINILLIIIVVSSVFYNIINNNVPINMANHSNDNCSKYINFRNQELNLVNNEMPNLRKYISNKNSVLLFYFTSHHCQVCFNSCLQMLNENVYSKNFVYVIGVFENPNMESFFKQKYSHLKILNDNDFKMDFILLKEINDPVFLELSTNGNIIDAFIPDKNYPFHIQKYIENAINKFKTESN